MCGRTGEGRSCPFPSIAPSPGSPASPCLSSWILVLGCEIPTLFISKLSKVLNWELQSQILPGPGQVKQVGQVGWTSPKKARLRGKYLHSIRPLTLWGAVVQHSQVSPSFKRNYKSGLFCLFKQRAGQHL